MSWAGMVMTVGRPDQYEGGGAFGGGEAVSVCNFFIVMSMGASSTGGVQTEWWGLDGDCERMSISSSKQLLSNRYKVFA